MRGLCKMSDGELNPEYLREVIAGADERDRADALVNLGLYHSKESELEEAGSCFASAVDIFEKLDKPFDLMYAQRFLADNLVRQDRIEESVEIYRKSLDLATLHFDVRAKAYAAGAMGDQLRALGRFDEAYDAHEIAAAAFQECSDHFMTGINLISLVLILHRRNQLQAAVERCSAAYNEFQLAGNPYQGGIVKELLAISLAGLGEFDEAVAHITDSIGIMNQISEAEREHKARFVRGKILLEAGQFDRAAEELWEVTDAFREHQRFFDAAQTELFYLVAKFRQDLFASQKVTNIALPRLRAFFDASGSAVDVVRVDRTLAEWYGLQGEWPKVVQILRPAIERLQDPDEPNLERSMRARLAQALIEVGERAEAAEVLATVSEADWGDVKSEIELLRRLRETLNLQKELEAN